MHSDIGRLKPTNKLGIPYLFSSDFFLDDFGIFYERPGKPGTTGTLYQSLFPAQFMAQKTRLGRKLPCLADQHPDDQAIFFQFKIKVQSPDDGRRDFSRKRHGEKSPENDLLSRFLRTISESPLEQLCRLSGLNAI